MSHLAHIWKNRLSKFRDNPGGIWPFLKKRLYYNFIADRYLGAYKDFQYLNYEQTIDTAIRENRSIVRFGDELFDMLQGIGLYFGSWRQRYHPELARRLKEIISSEDERLLICFNPELILKTRKEFRDMGIPEQYQFWTNSKMFLRKYYHPHIVYGSALSFHTRYNPDLDFEKLGRYFATKDVIIVTSNTARFEGLSLGRSTAFIEAPASDAWDRYAEIYQEVLRHIETRALNPKGVLVMVSMGSAAKVLVYDLMKAGYTAWDTGQFFDLASKRVSSLAGSSAS